MNTKLRTLFGASVAASILALSASLAQAEMAISVYGGYQSAPHSDVEVSDAPDFTAGWEGRSFEMPPYYDTLAESGWDHFEFSDGINLLTLNALYRMPIEGTKFVPYAGIGAGINVPHVEVTRGAEETFNYQLGGATVQAQAGIAYQFNDNWSAFVEYKGNYSWVDVDIDSGASLKTNIMTNAVNAGVSFHW